MRIQKVSFQNINSIPGPCTIDFDAIGPNLFLITGPTGSGKSTILDAITLALFGRTSRQERINGSLDEVMTRGKSSCESTVWFEESGEHYASTWKHRRRKSRKKEEPGTLETPEQILMKNGVLVSDKREEIEEKLYSILGMHFDQFVQAVMLAQGGFSKFLTAKPKEKSEILTQITGTGIYQQIGQKIYERTQSLEKDATYAKARMEEIHVLSEEESSALEARLIQLDTERNATVQAEEKAQASLSQWVAYEAQEKLLSEIALAEKELSSMTKEGESLYKAYEEDQKLNFLTTLDTKLSETKKREQEISCELLIRQADLALTSKESDKAKKRKEEVAIWSGEALLGIKEKEETLRQAKVADGQLPALVRNLEENQKQLQKKQESIALAQDEVEHLEHAISDKNAQKKSAMAYLKEHDKEANLGEILPLLEKESTALDAQRKIVDQAQKRRDEAWRHVVATSNQITTINTSLTTLAHTTKQQEQKLNSLLEQIRTEYQGESSISLRSKREQLKEANSLARSIMSLQAQRALLSEGDPCPLCGSTNHPYKTGTPIPSIHDEAILHLDNIIPLLEAIEKEMANTTSSHSLSMQSKKAHEVSLAQQKENLANQKKALTSSEEDLQREEERQESLKTELTSLLAPYGIQSWSDHTKEILYNHRRKWEEEQEKAKQADDQLAVLLPQLEKGREKLEQLSTEEEEKHVYDASLAVKTKKEEISYLLDGKTLLLVQKEIEEERRSLEQKKEEAEKAILQANGKVVSLEGTITLLAGQKKQAEKEREEHTRSLLTQLKTFGITTIEAFHDKLLSEEERDKARKEEKALLAKKEELNGLRKQLPSPLLPLPPLAKEEARVRLQATKDSLQLIDQKKGEEGQRQKRDQKDKEKLLSLKKEYQEKYGRYMEWKILCDLIGDKEGAKFQNFAQNISLRALIDYANDHLLKLADRYQLRASDAQPLVFSVYDAAQGAERNVTNLSGGESFLVSLALALGLASFSPGKTPIESLFLDEGFGTLDQETLEVAMKALMSLRHGGKQIGIISHVEMLKEEIHTQIEVTKGEDGLSKVCGKGVS